MKNAVLSENPHILFDEGGASRPLIAGRPKGVGTRG